MIIDPLSLFESAFRKERESVADELPVLMMWGDFIFQLSSLAYKTLTFSEDWTWAKQARIGKLESLQYTGKPAPSLVFDCELYADFIKNTDLSSIQASEGVYEEGNKDPVGMLRNQANTHTPLMLVTGTGEVKGFWVLTKVEQKIDLFRVNGEEQHQIVTLTMSYYGAQLTDDPTKTDASALATTSAAPKQTVLQEIKGFFKKVKDDVIRFI